MIASLVTLAPSTEAIEAGLLTEFMAALAIVGIFSILTFVLRTLRGR